MSDRHPMDGAVVQQVTRELGYRVMWRFMDKVIEPWIWNFHNTPWNPLRNVMVGWARRANGIEAHAFAERLRELHHARHARKEHKEKNQ